MKKAILSLAISLSLLTTNISLADFKSAVNSYQKGSYQEAFNEFQSLSKIGNVTAQFNLGTMYLDGLGVQKDLLNAYSWLKLSNEGKEDKEVLSLIDNIESELTGEELKKANKLYSVLSAKYGRQAIAKSLKPFLENSFPKLNQEIVPIKRSPADYPSDAALRGISGYVKLSFELSDEGKPLNVFIEESFPGKTFVRSSKEALIKWRFKVPENYSGQRVRYKMNYVIPNRKSSKAKSLFAQIQESAKKGDGVSQYYYAKYGKHFLKEEFNPADWYYRSAVQGVADSQYELALNLLHGYGCKVDREKGVSWLVQAASGGLGKAQYKLAQIYDKDGANTNDSARWLKLAVKSKDKDIAYKVAVMMEESGDYSPEEVLKQLLLATTKDVENPAKYLSLIAKQYYSLGDFESAVEHQKKANRLDKGTKNLSKHMQELLTKYKKANRSGKA